MIKMMSMDWKCLPDLEMDNDLNDDNVFVTIGPMTINKEEIRWVEVVR